MSDEYNDGILEIDLGRSGLIAWIDEEDEELMLYSWFAKKAGAEGLPHYYAIRQWRAGNLRGDSYLHNEVWERKSGESLPKGFLIDHINGDKLDNRRENLRLATRADNEANKKKRRTHAGKKPLSRYKGVTKMMDGRKKCWRSSITIRGKQFKLGTFYSEKEAAEAYNAAAQEHYGEFAYINAFEDEE